MGKIPTVQVVAVLAMMLLGVGYLEAPYLRLKADNLRGHLDYHALPVTAFTPGIFKEPTTTFGRGRLRFRAPTRAVLQGDNEEKTCLDLDGVRMCAFAPTPEGRPHYKALLDAESVPDIARMDSVTLIAAACAADCRNLSLWTGRKDADLLRLLLEVRDGFLPCVDQVETLRAPSIKGIVSIGTIGNYQVGILIELYSPEEDVGGKVVLILDSASEAQMNMARAIIDSLRLTEEGVN